MPQIDRIREASIPQAFPAPQPVMSREKADGIVSEALAKWQPLSRKTSLKVATTMQQEFPDQAHPEDFWHSEASGAFRDFFVWGHDHDFGNGVTRAGAMGTRHREITAEALSLGMLPSALKNMQVLDVGCWTGGDLLVLAGLGGWVTAIDEHPIAAKATRRLVALLRINAHVVETSLYADRQEWAQRFDFAYCSGVIYHVTDPMLLLRILFAYLKPGGSVFLETKATIGGGSVCSYSGTIEKGWNWYAPNETALGRWLIDAGFDAQTVRIVRRDNGRLLASGCKTKPCVLRESAGFSRPGSWLEGMV